jgi:hypothetical protein
VAGSNADKLESRADGETAGVSFVQTGLVAAAAASGPAAAVPLAAPNDTTLTVTATATIAPIRIATPSLKLTDASYRRKVVRLLARQWERAHRNVLLSARPRDLRQKRIFNGRWLNAATVTGGSEVSFDGLAREKNGRSWRIGTQADIDWIAGGTSTGLEITAAVPPVFEAYATLVIPEAGMLEGDHARQEQDTILVDLLAERSAGQSWWLGYLDRGAGSNVVFPDALTVDLYASWRYVLIEAGPDQAATWRSDDVWRSPVPDLIFPSNRSWLVSTLWDDDWRCLGGSRLLIARILERLRPYAHQVELGQDATPPGHVAR